MALCILSLESSLAQSFGGTGGGDTLVERDDDEASDVTLYVAWEREYEVLLEESPSMYGILCSFGSDLDLAESFFLASAMAAATASSFDRSSPA